MTGSPHRRGVLRRCAACALLATAAAAAPSADPFNYTVPVAHLAPVIYSDATARFRLTSADPDFALISTGYQSVLASGISGGRRTIEIRTGRTQKAPACEGDLSAWLADTRFLALSSPEIAQAALLLEKAADPVAATEDFVSRRIVSKGLGIPLIPADRVYRMRRGDCTEHTVLAVALLRKIGVPARAVVGMYLAESFGGKRNVFVYHMWAEACHRGTWRLVDAANPGAGGLNRYIAFAAHSLKTETPLAYLRAVSAIRDLTVAYLGR